MSNRYIGVLVNDSWYRRIPTGRMYHESLECYETAGRQHGVVPCFFRLKDIKPGQSHVAAYIKLNGRYQKCVIPVPQVIHNRTLYTVKRPMLAIRQLVADGKTVYNEWNRYGKKRIHDILQLNPEIRPHLPATREATPQTVKEMMNQFDKLILKPNSGSIGRGIMKLERTEDGWRLFGAGKPASRSILFRDRLPAVLLKKMRTRSYLVQQLLPLATVHGNPFDLRVSVQRGPTGQWTISGIVGKMARPKAYITNVARGGTVLTLEQILSVHPQMSPGEVRQSIERFSLQVAEQLSRHLPHMADIGLDIGLTEFGFPMFIECNGRDLRYSFRKGNLHDAFQAVYSNPIGYGKYLLETKGAVQPT
jgi:hypothetical protein